MESCVLGLASREEQLVFEQLCAAHPEIQQAREAFELGLEQYAVANAIIPPSDLKQKIWAEIQPAIAPLVNMPSGNNHSSIVRPLRRMNLSKYVAAAAVVLLLTSTALNFYFYRQYQSSVARLDELVKTRNNWSIITLLCKPNCSNMKAVCQ
jgi:hypothetical protein